jgi:hypothetical protein
MEGYYFFKICHILNNLHFNTLSVNVRAIVANCNTLIFLRK